MTDRTDPTALRIGASSTPLAIARAERIAARLGETVIIALPADADLAARRAALLRGDIDVLVHTAAELTSSTPGIELVAVPKRGAAEDVIITRTGTPLAALPAGAVVGVDTALRRTQVLAARPDVEIVDLPTDLETSLDRLEADAAAGGLDAIVIAAADLEHLGRSAGLESRLERRALSQWPTAPAQGALAVEIAATADGAIRRRVARIDHPLTRLLVETERAVLDRLPAEYAELTAADAMLEDGLLFLTATVYTPDGSRRTASHAGYPEDTADPAAELAARAVDELLSPPAEAAAH